MALSGTLFSPSTSDRFSRGGSGQLFNPTGQTGRFLGHSADSRFREGGSTNEKRQKQKCHYRITLETPEGSKQIDCKPTEYIFDAAEVNAWADSPSVPGAPLRYPRSLLDGNNCVAHKQEIKLSVNAPNTCWSTLIECGVLLGCWSAASHILQGRGLLILRSIAEGKQVWDVCCRTELAGD